MAVETATEARQGGDRKVTTPIKPSFVRLSGEAVAAEVRMATYAGVEHVVVPIVALKGGIVVTGLLSDGPEYIPPDVLAAAPGGWSGRPCIAYHPDDTANTPQTWDSSVFGQAFSATYSDDLLRVEGWLNPKQAERAGEDAVEVVAKALAGDMFEVSVGAWVWLEEEEGVSPSGEKYSYRWQAVVPDHIALGLQRHGGKGACSNEMGCGGPRVFSAKQAADIKDNKETSMPSTNLLSRLATKLGKEGVEALAEGMSDNDIRRKLNRALRAIVPGFWGVDEVFQADSTAIFTAMPQDSLEFWECAFTLDEAGEVTIGRRKQVEPVTEWKRVTKAADGDEEPEDKPELKTESNKSCKCHEADNGNTAVVGDKQPDQGKGVTMSDKATDKGVLAGDAATATLAGRLIANSAAPFQESDKDVLLAMGEEKLTALAAAFEKPEPAVDPNAVVIAKDKLAQLERLAAREEARDKQHRAQLVAALLATGRKGFDEKALNAKLTEELEALSEFAGIEEPAVTVGPGTFALSQVDNADINDYMPPDPWKSPPALAKQLGYRQ